MRKLISLIITLSFFIGFSKSHAQNINFFNQSYINQQTVTFQRVKTHPHASSCHLKREVVYKASYERILGTQCRRAKVGFEPGWLCRVSNRNNYQDWMDCAIGHVHNELYSTTPPAVGSKNQKRSILVDGKPNSEQETSQMDEYSTYLAMGLKTLPSVLKMGKEHFNSVNSGIKESRNKVEANIDRLNGFITNNEAINEDIIEETNQFLNQTTKKLNQKLADQEKIQQASNKVVSELKTSEERLTQKINEEINLKGIFDNIMSQKFNPFAYSDAPITSYPLPNTMTPSRDDFLEHQYKHRAGQLKDSKLKKELFEKSKLVTKFVKAKSDDLALQMAEEMEEYSLKDKGYIREVETPLLNRVQKFENDLTQYDIKGQILKDKIKNNLVKNPEMSQKALDISQGLREASEETFYKGDLETGEKGISLADNLLDMGLDIVPFVSTGKSAIELFTGKNPVTGEDLTAIERGISGVSIVLDAFTLGTGSIAVKSIAKGAPKAFGFFKNVGKKIFTKSNWKKAKKGFNEALNFGQKSFDSARKLGWKISSKFPFSDLGNATKSIVKNKKLPNNRWITKKEAKGLGWKPKAGNLHKIAPGKAIGGDIFKNAQNKLPKGKKYFEADLGYKKGFRNKKRMIYTNDGKIYLTNDHYKTFVEIK